MKRICISFMLIFSSTALFAQQKQVYDKVVEAADLDQYKTYYWGNDFAENDSQGQARQPHDQMKSEEMQQDSETDGGAREADELMPDADTTNLNVQMPEEQALANQQLNEATQNTQDEQMPENKAKGDKNWSDDTQDARNRSESIKKDVKQEVKAATDSIEQSIEAEKDSMEEPAEATKAKANEDTQEVQERAASIKSDVEKDVKASADSIGQEVEVEVEADQTEESVNEMEAKAEKKADDSMGKSQDKAASARNDVQEEREAEAGKTEATIETAEEEMGQAAEDVQAQATQVQGKMSENNQMKNKMIKNAIEYEFDVLGYDLEQNNPDLIINFTVFDKKYNKENGYNKAAYEIDADITTNDPSILSQLEDGTLIISAIDRKKGKNIWVGYVPEAFDPNSDPRKQQQSIRQAVSAAIETFAARINFEDAPYSRANDGNGDN